MTHEGKGTFHAYQEELLRGTVVSYSGSMCTEQQERASPIQYIYLMMIQQ